MPRCKEFYEKLDRLKAEGDEEKLKEFCNKSDKCLNEIASHERFMKNEVLPLKPMGSNGLNVATITERATRPVRHEKEQIKAAVIPKMIQTIRKGEKVTAPKVEKWVREARGTPKLPDGIFNLIYADPPWRYEFCESGRGDPENHYHAMPDEEIMLLNVPSAENAVLFLWATNPKLVEALAVLRAWGFTYRTNMAWVKDKFGTGFYFRGQHELLLVGVKGSVQTPCESDRPSSVLHAKVREHSRKPDEVYGIIEKMYPNATKLELFARNKREGWMSWGNECPI